jgi:hypothetical protein
LRFEVLTAVKKMPILVFWVVTPCGLAGKYQRFGGIYWTEDDCNMFLRNIAIYVEVHTALQPRRRIWTNRNADYMAASRGGIPGSGSLTATDNRHPGLIPGQANKWLLMKITSKLFS